MITVTGCRLLVKPFKLQDHDKVYARAKALGIEIPETSKRKEEVNIDRGTVLQIGENAHQDYVGHVKVGDVIGYAKFGGKFIADNDEEIYLIINDEDVICIIKD
jgi:co-chaperonin GroES (HSP10)